MIKLDEESRAYLQYNTLIPSGDDFHNIETSYRKRETVRVHLDFPGQWRLNCIGLRLAGLPAKTLRLQGVDAV
ncbi:hypothetical protein CJO92_21990 (plasmid) [Ralstonia solanacearum]|uniref:Uncharacterized protein n=1 Tax=Ralstonia solanacearum TaxID=305 RepID=A0AAD0SD67_RALSL|nr:hypothetical protein CJO77_21980 [Ralstonia solanacearum]AXW55320.1 hypothetical protein CJO92_21990 [Ralstonia solanacearum]